MVNSWGPGIVMETYISITGEKAEIQGEEIRRHGWRFLPGVVSPLRSSFMQWNAQHCGKFKHIIPVCNHNLLGFELKA